MTGRVLVTGASGFVGRPVVQALAARGFEVVGAARRRPQDLGGAAEWIEADVLAEAPERLVEAARAERLVHLAWIATPGVYAHGRVNADWLAASARLAEAFLAAGGRRIVGAGTCLEYDVDETGSRTLYGAAKHACRLAFERIAAANPGASCAWARIFYMLGRHDAPARFASALARSLARGEPMAVSTGQVERDFIDVRDCGEAIARLAGSDAAGAFDIATGRALLQGDLAARFAERAGRPDLLRVDPGLDRPGDPPRLVGDPGPLIRATGFSPRYSLEESIDDVLDFWRDQPV